MSTSTTSLRSALAGVLIGFAAAAAVFTTTRPAAQGQAPASAPAQTPGKAPGKAPAKKGVPAETTIPDKVRLFIPYKEYSQEDNQKILAQYKWLRVADISDGMDHVGLQDVGIVHQDIHALWKDTEKFTHRTVGIAVTARYVPTNKREPIIDLAAVSRWYGTITNEAFQQVITPGSMLVIDAMEDGETRSIGSNNIMAWKRVGMVGLVTSGGLADTDEIIFQKVPVWFRRLARGFRPGRNEIESVNRPVTIGGVLVRPGDVVAADGDGVIVVPREHAEAVAREAFRYIDQIQRELYIKETGQNPWANPGRGNTPAPAPAPAGRGRGGE
jgi:4-hydroxy-4-methyl-2-oxoglutarate aldolase